MNKHLLAIIALLFSLVSNPINAQNPAYAIQSKAAYPLEAKSNNFNTFTISSKNPDAKWLMNNKGFSNHPDAAFLPKDNPCPTAIEIIEKRTSNSKYFLDCNTASKFYIVKASEAINYQKNGQWLTIDKRLMPKKEKIFEADHQDEPVGFDVIKMKSYIKSFNGIIYFNNWQLSGKNKNGEKLLAKADWSDYSAGDDGLKVFNIFPGIDAEMIVDKGSIETNFIIKQNLFTGFDQLIFSDEFNNDKESELKATSKQNDINFIISGKKTLHISKAIMYAEKNALATYEYLNYAINNNRLSILVDANDLSKQLLNGNVIIDPLVSVMDSLPAPGITGSMGNCSSTPPYNSCDYTLQMQTPAKATITRIATQFGFRTIAPIAMKYGLFEIKLNACRTGFFSVDPNSPTSIDSPGIVSSKGNWYDIPTLIPCLPAPSCIPQNVSFTLSFLNTVCSSTITGCSDAFVTAEEAFQILIEGHTVEADPNAPNATPGTICQGDISTISALGIYGVPPYSYNWDNGAGNSQTENVSPSSPTFYTTTIKDQCGNTANSFTTVNVIKSVKPVITINASDTIICIGTGATFTAISSNEGVSPIYQWKLNGNNVGTNSQTYTNNNLADGDKISCLLTSNATCAAPPTTSSNIITMKVNPEVTPTITITSSANNVCFGTPVTFSATAKNAGLFPFYQWKINGIDAGDHSAEFTSDKLNDSDIVSCELSVTSKGCFLNPNALSNNIAMKIFPIPIIQLTVKDPIIEKGNSTILNADISENYSSFQWTPTIGLLDTTTLNPIASPLVTTKYSLSVTATNGCTNDNEILVTVYTKFYMPNAFTPGKNINTLFRIPPGIVFDLADFSIFDRWGQKIFETKDINEGWDGTYKDTQCTTGTYIYVITGNGIKGKVVYKGAVLLIR